MASMAKDKRLLVVFHSQTGNTERLARAVQAGACDPNIHGVEVRMRWALEAGPHDLMWCDAVLLGTPENFGYMSGAMKDFLDRTYYPCEGKVDSLPFALFISAGNDGRGAVEAIRRIARGYPLKEIQPPIIARGELTDSILEQCTELGATVAAGLEMGIF